MAYIVEFGPGQIKHINNLHQVKNNSEQGISIISLTSLLELNGIPVIILFHPQPASETI